MPSIEDGAELLGDPRFQEAFPLPSNRRHACLIPPACSAAGFTSAAPAGLQALPVGASRDSYLYVPPACTPTHPAPMVLLLHGADGHTHRGLDLLRQLTDAAGAILVAPHLQEARRV
jgi:poly(3-hydroxybutyrate) depolymerase